MRLFLASLFAFSGLIANPGSDGSGWREIAEDAIRAGEDFMLEWSARKDPPGKVKRRRLEVS